MVRELGSKEMNMWNDKDGSRDNNINGFSEVPEFQDPFFGSFSHPNSRDGGGGFQRPEADSKTLIRLQDFNPQEQPLGLTLRKTPSFVDLLEMKLSQGRNTNSPAVSETPRQSSRGAMAQAKMEDFASQEKLKASNFTASFLKIGTWERITRYEGDLVAKCYYAKRKLVWEILEKGLKSKMEIQWSDILGIRAFIQENEPGILEIELNQPPSFFRETNPQPRKHTNWQLASDFTGGQAPMHRRHFVKFPPGSLDKNYEKLLQCDNRLFELSRRTFPTLQSPYFHTNFYNFQEFPYDPNARQLHVPRGVQFHPSSFHPPSSVHSHQFVQSIEQMSEPSFSMKESTSPLLALNESISNHGFENQRSAAYWNQVMNTNAVMMRGNQIESAHPFASPAQIYPTYHDQNNGILGHIENQLLGDTQVGCPDEKMVLARVNSWTCAAKGEEAKAAQQMEFRQDGYAADDDSVLTFADHCNEANGQFYLQNQPVNWMPSTQVIDENLPMQIPRNNNSLFPYGVMEDFAPENNLDEVNNYWG